MAVPIIPEVRELAEAGVHFGHASGRWHPKMAPFIYATRDKLHIIDLEKTRALLEKTLGVLEERIRDGKTVVLVGTKKQVAGLVKEIGERTGLNYVNVRWLGGTMTNFAEIQRSIQRMKKTEEFLASEGAQSMIKKERVMMEAELERMRTKFGGLRNLTRKPEVLFVIDPSHEHNAIKEAQHQKIEVLAVVDTNSDPSQVDYIIPANDDGPKSLKLILGLVEQAILSGQKLFDLKKEAAAQEKAKAEEMTEEEEVTHVTTREDLLEVEEKLDEGEKPAKKARKDKDEEQVMHQEEEKPAKEKKEKK